MTYVVPVSYNGISSFKEACQEIDNLKKIVVEQQVQISNLN